MELNSLFVRILCIAFPGIIGSRVYNKLRGRGAKRDWESFLDIAIFSLFSYALLGTTVEILKFTGICAADVNNIPALFNEEIGVRWTEIALATIVAFSLAYAASAIYTHKWVNRLGQLIKATKRYGDEDVWDYFHNLPDVEWVIVRHLNQDLIYYGYIKAYSESEKMRELLLADVDIISAVTGKVLDKQMLRYVSGDATSLVIDVPALTGKNK